jgi:hypothetical protein
MLTNSTHHVLTVDPAEFNHKKLSIALLRIVNHKYDNINTNVENTGI